LRKNSKVSIIISYNRLDHSVTDLQQSLLREGYIDASYVQDLRICALEPCSLLLFRDPSLVMLDFYSSCDTWHKVAELLAKIINTPIVDLEEKESFAFLWKTKPVKFEF
jgi:hypothetical protein